MDQQGRFIIIQCEIQGKEFTFINTYAPNTELDQVLYFTDLRELFLTLECGDNASFVWGGDFNCPLTNRDVDKSEVKLKYKSINIINNIIDTFNSVDIWRLRNPLDKSFTWRSLHPIVQRRLDYFLISEEVQSSIVDTNIKPAVGTDHSSIVMILNSVSHTSRGPSHWRLNVSLLEDPEYNKEIRNLIEGEENFNSDPRKNGKN